MASSRGGRGGGSRGRGYTPPTGAQLYLKRSAQEAGLDDRNLRSLQDITMPGSLFSPLRWHSNGTLWKEQEEESDMGAVAVGSVRATSPAANAKRSSSTVYLIQKGRELRSRIQAQYQVRPATRHEQDVARHVNKDQNDSSTAARRASGGAESPSFAAKRVGPMYVPLELLHPSTTGKTMKRALSTPKSAAQKENPNLQHLEEKERTRRSDGDREGEEPAAALEQNYELSDEEDEAADYTMNYYESEGDETDGGGGDGGEPTF